VSPPDDPAVIALAVTEALDRLGVPYFIVGSLAAILHGVVRTTMDVDIVADIEPRHVRSLIQSLNGEFFVDEAALLDAVDARRHSNLIHRETMFKVDIYPLRDEPFPRSELARRILAPLTPDGVRRAYFASAEDAILSKLAWFRLGNEVSERQWRDVLGILMTQGNRIDRHYLRSWSGALGVDDLLTRAFEAATTR